MHDDDTTDTITLTVSASRAALARGLLSKAKATELSDLRRAQTQLSVYGDRRANMLSEPAVESRLVWTPPDDLIRQGLDAQSARQRWSRTVRSLHSYGEIHPGGIDKGSDKSCPDEAHYASTGLVKT